MTKQAEAGDSCSPWRWRSRTAQTFQEEPLCAGVREALRWALEYLEGYDHVGTGSGLTKAEQRDYDEKLETIRLMVGVERAWPRMKLGTHFAALSDTVTKEQK